jgi:hypothetical protein
LLGEDGESSFEKEKRFMTVSFSPFPARLPVLLACKPIGAKTMFRVHFTCPHIPAKYKQADLMPISWPAQIRVFITLALILLYYSFAGGLLDIE